MGVERLFYVLPLRMRALFRRDRVERDLHDEMRYHIDREIAFRMDRGEPASAARAAAVRDFGGVEFHKDYSRDTRGTQMIETFVRDVRFAFRSLRRAPAFTVVVVATLALGIGANSAVFSIIDAVLLHPLAVEHSAQLVSITEAITDQRPREPLSYPNYRAFAERNRSFTGIAAFTTQDAVVDIATRGPEQMQTSAAAGNYFAVLGLRAQIGRLLAPADDDVPGAHFVVVLSDRLWQRAYNRNPSIVGSTIKIGGNPFTIIGVAPRGFRGTLLTQSPELWVPSTMLTDLGLGGFLAASNRARIFTLPNFHRWSLVGRLRDGVTASAAAADLNQIFAQQKALLPTKSASSMGFAGREIRTPPIGLTPLNDAAAWSDRASLVRFLWILGAVVLLTLLIACFNVANLFLVRGGERSVELSVRASLGASRWRVAQQLGVESLLLGVAGAGGGVVLSRIAVRVLGSFTLPGGIRLADIPFQMNARVFGATIGLGALTALIFGLGPAIQASRGNLIAALRRTQASGGVDGRALLLAGEIALSIILLVGAGLFVRTMQAGLRVNLGFDPGPLAAVRINPALGGIKGFEVAAYYRAAIERAGQIPGVTGVTMATHVPLASVDQLPFVPGEQSTPSEPSGSEVNAGWVYIAPNYFDVLQVPIVAGRPFTAEDTARALSTAIINEAAAKALFPDGHPVGRQMVHAGMMRFTIVGVVRDTKYTSVQDSHVPMIFTPMTPDFNDDVQFIVRAKQPAVALAELRRVLATIPPRPPIREARLVADQVNAVLEPQRFGATLLGAYSLLGLLIASVGVYGLVAYIVARQRREIGIRIALGARPSQIVELVTSRIAIAVTAGVAVGLVAAALASRALQGFLYGVTTTDVPAFAAAAIAMVLAAMLACVLPARRALKMDPALAMRPE